MPPLAMQDWRAFVSYLPESLWERIVDQREQFMSLVDGITAHLIRMGLRCPSDPTQAMLAAILIKRSSRPIDDPVYLRSCFVNVKAQAGSLIAKAKAEQKPFPGDAYLVDLPASTADAPPAVLEVAFPDGWQEGRSKVRRVRPCGDRSKHSSSFDQQEGREADGDQQLC